MALSTEVDTCSEVEQERREAWLGSLHDVFRFFRDHPDLIPSTGVEVSDCRCGGEDVERELARSWVAALGSVDKSYTDYTASFTSKPDRFGPHVVRYVAMRQSVCERVVTTVEKEVEVPDPDALAKVPTIKQTVTEEVVTWDCQPILSEGLR